MRMSVTTLLRRSLLLAAFGLAPSSAQASAPPDLKQPNAYAVVIGVSQYREEVIPQVPYATKDAEAVAAMLERQAGVPKSHIKLLTDSKATVGDFRNHFGDWLRMRVKPDSTVYVYYAGHGTPNPKTGEAYLVPWEGHPDYPTGLYPLKELYDTLNKLPAKEIVVMLDSCFSGSSGRSVLAKGARPMVITMENPLLAGGKVTVLAAASGNQISSDYDKAGHGLFTHYLLAGLSGEADTNKDQLVSLKELYPYVRDHVSETAVDELNREQTPMLLPGEEELGQKGNKPLVRVDPNASVASVPKPVHQAPQPDSPKQEVAKPEAPKPILEARARPYETPRMTGKDIAGKDGAPMALVPAGEFSMGNSDGDSDEKPAHSVSLDAFFIDKFEVTTMRYAKFVQETNRPVPPYWNQVAQASDGERPVVGVDWHDADAYCRHYGKRLPTEAEWEKAARGADERKYPWGNDLPMSDHARFGQSYRNPVYKDGVAPVGSYPKGTSPFGIHDLSGNVSEWIADWFSEGFARSDLRNPKGPDVGTDKVLRGGGWYDQADRITSTKRFHATPGFRSVDVGFRCASDLE